MNILIILLIVTNNDIYLCLKKYYEIIMTTDI